MSDIEWGSEAKEAPKKKARLPKWLWFCGGGCLLAQIASAVIAFVVFRVASEKLDPEKQWTALAEVLPYDERPADYMLIPTGALAAMAPGVDNGWQFTKGGASVQLQLYAPGQRADELRERLETGDLGESKQQFGPLGFHAPSAGQFEIQGRKLNYVRFQTFEESESPGDAQAQAGDSAAGSEQAPVKEPTEEVAQEPVEEPIEEPSSFKQAMEMATKQRVMLVDITPEGREGALLLIYSRFSGTTPVEQRDIEDFLQHFRIDGKK